MKDQWMASFDMRNFHSLDALHGSLSVFVRSYNLTPYSSLKGRSPQDRFFSEPETIRRLDIQRIETGFLSGTGAPRFRRQCDCHRRGGIRSGLPLRKTAHYPALFPRHERYLYPGARRLPYAHKTYGQTGKRIRKA